MSIMIESYSIILHCSLKFNKMRLVSLLLCRSKITDYQQVYAGMKLIISQ